jgi:hypothetical protein
MQNLKLVALDKEDLEILSAHLQDAVLKIGDMVYQPKAKRFAAVARRFDWEKAHADGKGRQGFERRQAALRFERVTGAKLMNVPIGARNEVLSLLAVTFEEGIAPSGAVTLHFSGGAAIRLEVECIEAELKDLGLAWRTRSKPEHKDEGAPAARDRDGGKS